ncbi:L,D-transpeptidase [Candidatus Kaiserbacteria bacterium]|nr:MAG: L,D-transpeptidase [Candidatus Kaiserbacteria bacterium]
MPHTTYEETIVRKSNVLQYILILFVLSFSHATSAVEESLVSEANSVIKEAVEDSTSATHFDVETIPDGFSISVGKAQSICYFRNGVPLHCAKISSGAQGHRTPTGYFSIKSKEFMHYSRRYKDQKGRPAPMPRSMHFHEHYFIHEGKLPGHPASHGCIRVANGDAKKFFHLGQVGDPVVITM